MTHMTWGTGARGRQKIKGVVDREREREIKNTVLNQQYKNLR